ncbi:hypothetical protein [Marinobacterium sp. BA1]|uniref:hypothetical protein n=1 Tax=Marinobacterium sp. BA1 TaxID=3138931 RepID=UPI0032E56020
MAMEQAAPVLDTPDPVKTKPKSIGVGAVIWLVIFVVGGYGWMSGVYKDSNERSEPERVEERASPEPRPEPKPKKVLTPAEQRAKDIRRQFSAWDGSHRNLEALIQDSLHDPDSYDHVETRYSDKGDHLMVALKYRAVNGFGAKRLYQAIAKVGLDGTIISVIDNSQL